MFNLLNIVAKDFKALKGACKCLQELGILYPEKFKIVTPQYPQMMPKIPPEDFLFRAPRKNFQSLGTMVLWCCLKLLVYLKRMELLA